MKLYLVHANIKRSIYTPIELDVFIMAAETTDEIIEHVYSEDYPAIGVLHIRELNDKEYYDVFTNNSYHKHYLTKDILNLVKRGAIC